MPPSVITAERMIAVAASQPELIQCAASHQSATVIADAYVPGPGYMCPTPKKVAISQEPRDFEFFGEATGI